jgi:uncharacterized membrane protein YphA (DoxX/SURF4 family)
MSADQPKWKTWTGRVLSALPVIALVMSGVMKLTHNPKVVEGFGKFGYQESALTTIGVVELLCALLYAIPQTTLFGAVLVAAYLGGAVATHARLADPSWVTPVLLGIFAWVGLWLREPRLRDLAPLRK